MKHAKLNEVTITSSVCVSEKSLHDYLKEEIGFPDYYGGNLSALADCLSELSAPTLISISIDENELVPGMAAYLLRMVQTIAREALANESLSLIIEHC